MTATPAPTILRPDDGNCAAVTDNTNMCSDGDARTADACVTVHVSGRRAVHAGSGVRLHELDAGSHPRQHPERSAHGDHRRVGARSVPLRRRPQDLLHAHLPRLPRLHAEVAAGDGRDDLDRQRPLGRQRPQRDDLGRRRRSGQPGAVPRGDVRGLEARHRSPLRPQPGRADAGAEEALGASSARTRTAMDADVPRRRRHRHGDVTTGRSASRRCGVPPRPLRLHESTRTGDERTTTRRSRSRRARRS